MTTSAYEEVGIKIWLYDEVAETTRYIEERSDQTLRRAKSAPHLRQTYSNVFTLLTWELLRRKRIADRGIVLYRDDDRLHAVSVMRRPLLR